MGIFKLTGKLRIQEASDVKVLLRDFLQQQHNLSLDLSAVEECDAAGLQLLLAAQKTAQLSGKTFQIATLSEPVQKAMRLCGLTF